MILIAVVRMEAMSASAVPSSILSEGDVVFICDPSLVPHESLVTLFHGMCPSECRPHARPLVGLRLLEIDAVRAVKRAKPPRAARSLKTAFFLTPRPKL